MEYVIAITILFWVSPLTMIVFHAWWSAYIWQINKYDLRQIIKVLFWEFSDEHRSTIKTVLKLNGAIFTFSGLLAPSNVLSYIGIFVLQAIWFNNALLLWQRILNRQLADLQLKIRSLAAIFAYILVMAIVVSSLASTQLILPNGAGIQYFVVVSAVLAAIFDLGSIIFISIFILITTPIHWIHTWLVKRQAVEKLQIYPHLIKIVIGGDNDTRMITKLLEQILLAEYKVHQTHEAIDSPLELYKFLKHIDHPKPQVLLIELDDWADPDAYKVAQILNPDFVVLTGIDVNSTTLFGNQEKMLLAKQKLLNTLANDGTAILNIDDELTAQLAGQILKKEIYVHTTATAPEKLPNTELEIETYFPQKPKYIKHFNNTVFNIKLNQQKIPIKIPGKHLSQVRAITMAIAVARELHLTDDDITQKVSHLEIDPYTLSKYPLPNQTTLLRSQDKTTLASLKRDLTYLDQFANGDKYLITKGLAYPNRYKSNIYKKLAKLISESVQVLITYDENLAAYMLQHGPPELDVELVIDINTTIIEISRRLEYGDTLLINREIDINVIRFFVDR